MLGGRKPVPLSDDDCRDAQDTDNGEVDESRLRRAVERVIEPGDKAPHDEQRYSGVIQPRTQPERENPQVRLEVHSPHCGLSTPSAPFVADFMLSRDNPTDFATPTYICWPSWGENAAGKNCSNALGVPMFEFRVSVWSQGIGGWVCMADEDVSRIRCVCSFLSV